MFIKASSVFVVAIDLHNFINPKSSKGDRPFKNQANPVRSFDNLIEIVI